MEFPLTVIAILTVAIALSSVSFWIGFYLERFNTWRKSTFEGKVFQTKTQSTFGSEIVEGKYYDARNPE